MKLKFLTGLLLISSTVFAQQKDTIKTVKNEDGWETASWGDTKKIEFKVFDNSAVLDKKLFLNVGAGLNNMGTRWFFNGNVAAVYYPINRIAFNIDFGKTIFATKGTSYDDDYLKNFADKNKDAYQQTFDLSGTYYFKSKTKPYKMLLTLDRSSRSVGYNQTVITEYVVQKDIEQNTKFGINIGFKNYRSDKAVPSTYVPSKDSLYFISDNSRYILKTGLRIQGNHNYEIDFKTKKTAYSNQIYTVDFNILTLLGSNNTYMMFDKSSYKNSYSAATIPASFKGDLQSKIGWEISTGFTSAINDNFWSTVYWSIGVLPGRYEGEGYFRNFMFKLNYSLAFGI